MEVLVDSNLIFSALLREGRVARLLLQPNPLISFYAPGYLVDEIERHWERIIFFSGISSYNLQRSADEIFKNITLLNFGQVDNLILDEAERICASIDAKDSIFIAFSLFFELKLWTGDRKLRKGLEKKGYFICISTDELYKYLNLNLSL